MLRVERTARRILIRLFITAQYFESSARAWRVTTVTTVTLATADINSSQHHAELDGMYGSYDTACATEKMRSQL